MCDFTHFCLFFFFSNWKLFFRKAFQTCNRGRERSVLERHIPLIGFPRPLTDRSPSSHSRSYKEGSSSESALKVLFLFFSFFRKHSFSWFVVRTQGWWPFICLVEWINTRLALTFQLELVIFINGALNGTRWWKSRHLLKAHGAETSAAPAINTSFPHYLLSRRYACVLQQTFNTHPSLSCCVLLLGDWRFNLFVCVLMHGHLNMENYFIYHKYIK